MIDTDRSRLEPIHVLGIIAFALLVGLPSLNWVMGRDQGIYAYSAWAWLEGATLYRDVYVFKPPGTVLVHALSQLLFGPHMSSIRLLDWLLQAATAGGLAVVVAFWSTRPRIGLLAGLLYAPSFYRFGFWGTAQTDSWFVPCVVFALWAVTRAGTSDRPSAWSLGAGLAIGFATVLKYTALAFVLPTLVVALFHWWRGEHDRRPTAMLLLGLLLPLLAMAAWLASAGAWSSFLDCQATLVGYADHVPKLGFVAAVGSLTHGIPPLSFSRPMLAGALGLPEQWQANDPRPRAGVVLWAAWMVAALASLISQGRYFGYHAVPLLPPLVWTGAIALTLLTRPLGRWATLGGVLLVVGVTFQTPERFWAVVTSPTVDREAKYRFHFYPRSGRKQVYRPFLVMADYLRENTDPDETVFVWGYDPVVMFLAQRRQASRYLYNFPMVVAWQDGSDRAELMSVLRERPPGIVAVASGDATPAATGNPHDSLQSFEAFEDLSSWVDARYDRKKDVAGYRVYHLRE